MDALAHGHPAREGDERRRAALHHRRQPRAAAAGGAAGVARRGRADDTGTVTAELRLVPNQPVVFKDDPEHKPRTEDDFIAYTWNKFLRTGDEKWPARLPMTKSAVRAMDAVTAFAASPDGGGSTVAASSSPAHRSAAGRPGRRRRSTHASIAIAPAVIDMLNVEPSFIHHYRAYGEWSDAVKDYAQQGIMDWMGTPQFRALMKIEEPYEYRERLTMPKFLRERIRRSVLPARLVAVLFRRSARARSICATSRTRRTRSRRPTRSRISRRSTTTIVKDKPRPQIKWTFEKDGSIKVVAKDRPDAVLMWQATNPDARNFRQDAIGNAYSSTPLTPDRPEHLGGARQGRPRRAGRRSSSS